MGWFTGDALEDDEEGMVSHSIASVSRMKSDDSGARPVQLDAGTEEWARQGGVVIEMLAFTAVTSI